MKSPTLAILAGLILGVPTENLMTLKTGSVQGTVREAGIGGGPLAGALVTIEGTLFRTLTDRLGKFVIAGVPVGRARVGVVYVGFAPQKREVDVRDGQAVTADFTLTPVASPRLETESKRAAGTAAPSEMARKSSQGVNQPTSITARDQFNTEEYGHREENQWQSPVRQPLSTSTPPATATSVASFGKGACRRRMPCGWRR